MTLLLTLLRKTITTLDAIPLGGKAFGVFFSFFAPLSSIVHAIIFLLIIDAVTSIYYQICVKTKEFNSFPKKVVEGLKIIESRRLRRTLEKMFFYVLVIISFFIVDVVLFRISPEAESVISGISLTNIGATMVALVELWSIASNVSKITGNDVFLKVLDKWTKKNNLEDRT